MKLKRLILSLTVLFAMMFFSYLVFAQETTGNLKGKIVFKEDNSTLSGISITIDSPSLMGIRTTISDAKGYYRFPSLPPGVYRVKAEASGFKTIIREGIIINVGKTTTLNFFMETATVKETVVVKGESPMVDLEKSGLSLNVKGETLQILPMPRDYLQVIQLAPGINTTSDNPSVHGESNWNNQYLMDGVDTTDPDSGGPGTTFNFDIIDEMEFETGGYKAEYGQVMGAVINIVTKSGGNNFSGSINLNLQDPSLTGENVPEEEKEAHPVKNSLRDYSFTLGGPIKKDKVWFFSSFQYVRSINERDDVSYKNKNEAYRWMGKITSQLGPNHKIVILCWGDPYNNYGSMLDPYWAYETNPRSFGGAKINAAGIWNWTISNNAFLQTKVSRFHKNVNMEPTQDDSISHYYDIVTQQRWGNYTFHFLTDHGRYQANSDFVYFLDDFLGSHQLKTGISYTYSYERKRLWTVNNGWGIFLYFNGIPYMAQYKPGKEDCKARSNRLSYYAQDTWKISDRLVFNPGIRFDYTVGKNDILEKIHDYKTISPRFGFVYQLTKDGKTILKGSYSKYYENPFLFFPDIFNKGKTASYMYLYNPWTGKYDILLLKIGGPSTYKFLNELKSPYLNEYILGLKREILTDFSVGLNGIYRKTKNIIEDVETNLLYEDPNNPYTPTGSKDGTGQPIMAVGNPDEAYREYKGLEITLEKRMANNWMFFGSYTLSQTKGTVSTSFTGFLDSPGETVNRDGYLAVDRRHIVKLAGSYIFPYGINVGFQYRLLSGFPYTKLLINPFNGYYGIYETPLGEKDPETGKVRRYPTLHSFDLRIEKTFKVWKGQFGIYADIYNVLNANTPISYYTFDNPLYGKVARRVSPINARVNVRYSF